MFHEMKKKRSFVIALSTMSTLLILLVSYQNCGKSLTARNSTGHATGSSLCEGICPSPSSGNDDNETLADHSDDGETLSDNDQNASNEPLIGDSPSSPDSDDNGSGENEGIVVDDSVIESETYTPPNELTVLSTLRTGHPRLIVTPERLLEIKQEIHSNSKANAHYQKLLTQANRLLTQSVYIYGEALGGWIQQRIQVLAFVYRINGEKKYADRAIKEMLAVAGFSDWISSTQFLEVSHITHGVALGYDWLFEILSAAQRNTIKRALVEKGLKPAKVAFETGASWTTGAWNWNLVCNGGIAMGTLAIADEEPDLARFLLYRNITSATKNLAVYAPDGAYMEGPSYWSYATDHAVKMFAALKSALGTDFGLSSLPGLSATGLFFMHSKGPVNQFFNFADSPERPSTSSLFWLSKRFNKPALSFMGQTMMDSNTDVFHLAFFDPSGTTQDLLGQPRDVFLTGNGISVAYFRSKWEDVNAAYIGFKGGTNGVPHGNLDLGTFVYDSQGQRWAIDLGSENYSLSNYWSYEKHPGRSDYYRTNTFGQNTLVIRGLHKITFTFHRVGSIV